MVPLKMAGRQEAPRSRYAVPILFVLFAAGVIYWMIYELGLAWERNDSWGFTVVIASILIPIFLLFVGLAIYVFWGIAASAGPGRGPEGR